jgi:hypothetical protein
VIGEAISSARIIVLILTQRAAASPHIVSEVGQAFKDKQRIIPFHLSAEHLPQKSGIFPFDDPVAKCFGWSHGQTSEAPD